MTLKESESIKEFSPESWRPLEQDDFPFMDYEFLAALEESGAVGAQSGWVPRYFAWEHQGVLEAVLLTYLKSHSYGEYVFDWQIADIYERAGGDYYPKLLAAIPFTPATGTKILSQPETGPEVKQSLWEAADRFAERHQLSSCHHLFMPSSEVQDSYLPRFHLQFHWQNQNYQNFDDFLSRLKSKKRRNIQKERRECTVSVEALTGDQINEEALNHMWQFYSLTIEKKCSFQYLNKEFFMQIGRTMADRILLCLAHDEGRCVGASICFFKGKKLYGRHWGGLSQYRHLHFELCFYRPMEFAIANGLQVFEAGAQGPHKWQRGFLPVLTYSEHKFYHPQFHDMVGRFFKEERLQIEAEIAGADEQSPFR